MVSDCKRTILLCLIVAPLVSRHLNHALFAAHIVMFAEPQTAAVLAAVQTLCLFEWSERRDTSIVYILCPVLLEMSSAKRIRHRDLFFLIRLFCLVNFHVYVRCCIPRSRGRVRFVVRHRRGKRFFCNVFFGWPNSDFKSVARISDLIPMCLLLWTSAVACRQIAYCWWRCCPSFCNMKASNL